MGVVVNDVDDGVGDVVLDFFDGLVVNYWVVVVVK